MEALANGQSLGAAETRRGEEDTMNLAESDEALAFVKVQVEEALEPYLDLLSPLELDEMRAYLTDVLLLHPTVSEMTARLMPRPPILESGEVGEPNHSGDEATAALVRGDKERG